MSSKSAEPVIHCNYSTYRSRIISTSRLGVVKHEKGSRTQIKFHQSLNDFREIIDWFPRFRVMHEPAKADMTIAHSSDDDSTPPPLPPGPPAMDDHELIFWKQGWTVVGEKKKKIGQLEGQRRLFRNGF